MLKMKSILFFLPALMLVHVLTAQTIAIASDKSILTSKQRTFAAEYLQETKQAFFNALEGLTEEQLKFKAKDEKWCILDCAEHIALAERTLAGVVQKQLLEPADSLKFKKLKMTEKKIISRLTFRLIKVKAPEVIKPTGQFKSIDDIKHAFMNQRDSTINYVLMTQAPLHYHYWKHPATGVIDLYQTLILMSAHTQRHILQILEVKKNAKFPRTANP